jgi:predicted DNA-binding protein
MALLQTRTAQKTAERFAKLAKRNERSTAAELRIAIDQHLAANDSQPKRGERT